VARDEWYDLWESGAMAEEAARLELESDGWRAPEPQTGPAEVPMWERDLADVPSYFRETERRLREHVERVMADWHKPGRHCPNCLTLLESEDAICCLACGSLLTAPIRAHSETEARRRGWIA
jgi:hypothetical protein